VAKLSVKRLILIFQSKPGKGALEDQQWVTRLAIPSEKDPEPALPT